MTNDYLNSFYKKKIFITGHTGFKGAWFSLWLTKLGAKVKGYALKPEKKSLFNQIEPSLKITSVFADIRDREKLKKEILKFQPDFIFHLAAQPIVFESYKTPIETFETNIIGTAHLLDALKFLKKKCAVVIITTDKVYQNIEKNYAYKETDKLGGYDPYSASKAAAELIIDSYRSSFFNPENFNMHKKAIASARAGNVIGGGDYAKDRLVPDIFKALCKGDSILVRNPDAVRPWQHVLESLSGYLQLAFFLYKEPQKFATSFNFGPALKDTKSVEHLVKRAIASWGAGNYHNSTPGNAPHEAGLLKLNIEKAKNELGWMPRWNSDLAIDKTIQWYRNSIQKNSDIFNLCINNINDFVKYK